MTDLRSTIESHVRNVATELTAVIRQQLTQEVRDEVRAEVFSSLNGMSLAQIMAAISGSNGAPAKRGPGRPKKVSAGSETGNGGPVRRGPGRPKRVATAAAPKGAAAPKAAKEPKAKKLASGRLARRSPEDIAKTLTTIKALLAKHPKGLRSEQIGKELGLDKKELPRPLSDGIAAGALRTTGQKRATTYFLSGGGGNGAGTKKGKKQ